MTLAPQHFAYVRDLVHRRAAIVLEPGKEYLVESRLLPLARSTGDVDVAALVARLKEVPETHRLHELVVDAMTTNETSWFRDHHPFAALATAVVPDLIRRRGAERSLRIWSAACSSGQEPYTIAMTLADLMAAQPGWRLEILGTDLSAEMLERARAGRYSQLEINRGLPAPLLVRHFERAGTEWQVREPLRRQVTFRPLNLAAPFPPLPTFDVVFLRNVLIYFDTRTKREVLARVRAVLRPDGYLFLGGAETTLNIDDSFDRVQFDRATAYRLRGGEA